MRRDSRGVSNVVGVVLLIAVVLSASALVAGLGAETMTERTRAVAGETAVADLSDLAEAAETVTHSGQDRQRVSLAGTDSTQGKGLQPIDGGRLSIAVGSATDGWSTVTDVSLSAVGVRARGTTIAYQGGGVWKRTADGSVEVMRAPPLSVVERSATTVTLPVVALDDVDSITGDATVELGEQTPVYEPLFVPTDETVRIRIESTFAAGWARSFERAVSGGHGRVVHDASSGTVTVTIDAGDLYLHGSVHRLTVEAA